MSGYNTNIINEIKRTAKFRVNSKLITRILGSEIIESHSIAFAEQIKNSKDAGASKVIIDFSNIEKNIITIEDDGYGMTPDEIVSEWFMLGNDKKETDYSATGGKGIGRLSLFKIGKVFEIETVSNGELTRFTLSEDSLLNQDMEEHEEEINSIEYDGEPGTKIVITNIDSDIDLSEIELELENLKLEDSLIDLKIIYPSNYKKRDFLTPEEIMQVVPFSADVFINKNEVKYSFTSKLNGQIIYKNDQFLARFGNAIKSLLEEKSEALSLGDVSFKLNNFFFERGYKDYIPLQVNGKDIKGTFLSVYQGINIYRNGFKIYGHGSEDWLKLAENRVSKQGENIDNKLTFGTIILDDKESAELKEKSSREGLIRNPSSKAFRKLILLIVKQFGQDRASATKIMKNQIKDIKKEKKEESNKPKKEKLQQLDNTIISNPSLQNNINNVLHENNKEIGKEEESTKNNESIVPLDHAPMQNDESKKYRRLSRTKLHPINTDIFKSMKNCKSRDLLDEIQSINYKDYTYATAYLLRAIVEILMNEYIIKNYDTIKSYFPNYQINEDKKIIVVYNENKKHDVSNRKKILDFKCYFNKLKKFDVRSLKNLDDLADFIDELNLSIHWVDKTVSIDKIDTAWMNSMFFIEYLVRNI